MVSSSSTKERVCWTFSQAIAMIPLLTSIVTSLQAAWSELLEAKHELERLSKLHPKPKKKEKRPRANKWSIQLLGGIENDITPTISKHDVWEPPQELVDATEKSDKFHKKVGGYLKEVEDLGCHVVSIIQGVVRIPSRIHGSPAIWNG